MRALLPLAFAVAFVSACSSDEPTTETFANREQAYVVSAPATGWTRESKNGAVIITGSRARAKHTIVIRSIPRPQLLTEQMPATVENVVEMTRRALTHNPVASIDNKRSIKNIDSPAVEFTMTFQPPSAEGRRYQRRHAVVIAKAHIFHVFYTAPAGEAVDARTFEEMVSSIREAV